MDKHRTQTNGQKKQNKENDDYSQKLYIREMS